MIFQCYLLALLSLSLYYKYGDFMIIENLFKTGNISNTDIKYLLSANDNSVDEQLMKYGSMVAKEYYGNKVFLRGLIEFTNYCKNNCYYCGIRRDNLLVQRYRLSKEDILLCCKKGYSLGFRTFVLQGGEDNYFSDDKICRIVSDIKENFPDCAVTLSIGEKSYNSYKAFFNAGADRYLLRHETANNQHYSMLHPDNMSGEYRKECLYSLKEIGFQVGCGIMVGSPYQTTENIIEDIRFMQELSPDMIGIGPFISHKDTPFYKENNGSVLVTLRLISILRIMFRNVLLPATTALGTLMPKGREKGILYGANVVMPNLSPESVREKYTLYDNKISTGEEAAEGVAALKKSISSIGYEAVVSRGDRADFLFR